MRCCLVTLSLLLGASLGSAQSVEPELAAVGLRAYTTPMGGRASTTGKLDLGDTVRFHVATGSSSGTENLCALGIGGLAEDGGVRALLNEAHRVWALEVRVLAVVDKSFDVALVWSRYRAGRRDSPVKERETRRRLKLLPNEPYFVDFFAEPTPVDNDSCAAQNLLIELRVLPSTKESDLKYRYDLLRYEGWLVYERANGDTTTSQFTARGRHGEPVRFRFEPLHQQAGTGAASALDVVTEFFGSVSGRKRTDGTIDLILRADQQSSVIDETGLRLPTGSGGEKKLNVQPGEVIRIDLPHPAGRSAHRLAGQTSTLSEDVRFLDVGGAISIHDDLLVVDLAEFYRGTRASITLSVTPIE